MLPIEDIEKLESLLEETGQETMNAEEVHGLLTAIACGPVRVEPDQWLPLVFLNETDIPACVRGASGKPITDLLLRFWDETARDIASGEFAPLIGEFEEDGESFLDPGYWCSGFMVGSRFAPDAWHNETDIELMELLAPIVFLSDPDSVYEELNRADEDDKQQVEEEFMDGIAERVPKIRAHLKNKYPSGK